MKPVRLASVTTPCHLTLHGTNTAVPNTGPKSANINYLILIAYHSQGGAAGYQDETKTERSRAPMAHEPIEVSQIEHGSGQSKVEDEEGPRGVQAHGLELRDREPRHGFIEDNRAETGPEQGVELPRVGFRHARQCRHEPFAPALPSRDGICDGRPLLALFDIFFHLVNPPAVIAPCVGGTQVVRWFKAEQERCPQEAGFSAQGS